MSIHLSRIALGNGPLLNGIQDLSAVFVDIQTGKCIGPARLRFQLCRCHNLSVCQQIHHDASRTLAILVIAIVPCFGNDELCLFRHIAVGNGISDFCITGHICSIAGHRSLLDGIGNFPAAGKLVQIRERSLPIICRTQHQNAARFFSVSQQLDFNCARAFAILVLRVLPYLLNRNADCFGGMGVGNDVAVHSIAGDVGSVACYGYFLNGIGNFAAALMLVQLLKLSAPLIGFVQGQRLTGTLTVGQQIHRDGGRTQAILVVSILPHLADRYFRLLRNVGIGNDEALGRRTGNVGGIAGYRNLFDGIDDVLPVLLLVQILKLSRPLVCLVQSYRLSGIGTVSQKFDRNAFRPLAIPVVSIVPFLCDRNVHVCRRQFRRRVRNRNRLDLYRTGFFHFERNIIVIVLRIELGSVGFFHAIAVHDIVDYTVNLLFAAYLGIIIDIGPAISGRKRKGHPIRGILRFRRFFRSLRRFGQNIGK